jgi:hypothetical protein
MSVSEDRDARVARPEREARLASGGDGHRLNSPEKSLGSRIFCFWLFDLMGMKPGDDLVDLFPGTGGVMRAWEKWQRHMFWMVA